MLDKIEAIEVLGATKMMQDDDDEPEEAERLWEQAIEMRSVHNQTCD